MKIPALLTIVATAVIPLACSKKPDATGKARADVELFNGTNLDGWSHVLVGDAAKKEDVWSVKNGVLVCKGEPQGYLFTNGSYQDFTLSFEWRWAPGGTPGNSGVLVRIAGKPATFMPKCVEAQLKHENAGDVWAFFGAAVQGPSDRFQEVKNHETLGDFKGYKKIAAAEKVPGEWNQYQIKVSGGDLELRINGQLVNRVGGLDVVSGPIGLQSEGSEIHFRNIRLAEDRH